MRNAANAAKPAKKRASRPRRKKPRTPTTMELMGVVTWTDPMRKPEGFVINAPYDPASERALLHLDLDLRVVASVEIRPARRPLTDKEGVVADALRLANTPL